VYDRVSESYDRVAERYAAEIGGELAGKPLDRALLRCLHDLVDVVEESSGGGVVADLGCGPGHVAAYLASAGLPMVGIDISPGMIEVGKQRYPDVTFREGSLLRLPATDGEFLSAIVFYSTIHLRPDDRPRAYREMFRVIRPGGWLLLAFHSSPAEGLTGEIMHVEEWWGAEVDLDFYYLDATEVVDGIEAAGFTVTARTDRSPWPGVEHQSRRCYLLCQRPSTVEEASAG
jgi:ubiquinone/menaquinone biosynthesis C-methylase UbiE